MGENNCPYCDSEVVQDGLKCDTCASWVHYSCSNLPPYMIILLSKSTRAFSCHLCVHNRYKNQFPALHTDIESIIKAHKDSIEVNVAPSSPSDDTLVQPPPPPSDVATPTLGVNLHLVKLSNDVATSMENGDSAPTAPTPVKLPCKFYMQGHCKHGKQGRSCPDPHPPMCNRFTRSGPRGCSKGSKCKYVHPKLCRSSVNTYRCDRRNCHFYHILGTVRPHIFANSVTPPRPTPLFQARYQPSAAARPSSSYLPSHQSCWDQQTHASHTTPTYNHPPPAHTTGMKLPIPHIQPLMSNYATTLKDATPIPADNQTPIQPANFLEQLTAIKDQMSQMQHTQRMLIQNLTNQAWPPLPSQKVLPFQLFQSN